MTRLPRPRRAYIVCATPRSGSTLLCELLAATGVAGRPDEHIERLRAPGRPMEPREYFAGIGHGGVLALLPASAPEEPDPAPVEDRLAGVLEQATTRNGVFGTKLMWSYMGDLQERLAELPGIAAQADAERLAEVLGDVRYVHVTREDRVAQAISLWRAVQTRAWRAGEDQRRAPVYSFAGIDHLVHRLEADDRAWDAWFKRHGVVPLRLRYGEIAGDPHDALRRTLVHLGVADEPHDVPAVPPLRRQAGAQSREWAARYAADRDGG